MYRFPLLAMLLLFSFVLQAEPIRYYAVELILFENLDTRAHQAETWPKSIELEIPQETSIEIGQPFPGKLPEGYLSSFTFKPLKSKEYLLNEQAEKINSSESRRVLLHTGWRQPGMASENAITVHLKKKIPAVPGTNPTTVTSVTDDTGETTTSVVTSPYVEQKAGELEGLVKVILSRYLHVEADIVFRPQQGNTTLPRDIYASIEEPELKETPVVYRLNQTRRRMRSRELHYLDNPVLGMLVLITPFESKN